jgi:hypothetical protein
MENNSKNNTDNKKVESSQNNTLKVDITKLKKIEKGSLYSYETYEMLVDEDGNEYELDGTPVKKFPSINKNDLQKMVESGELKVVSYFNIAHSDIFDVYSDKDGNLYDMQGNGMK